MSDIEKIERSDFLDPYKEAFESMAVSYQHGTVALVECTDKKTGERAAIVCVVIHGEADHFLVPVARMLSDDETDQYEPPTEIPRKHE